MNREPVSFGESLPFSVEVKIDQVCQQFEGDWKSGNPPRIEHCLADCTGPHRRALLEELLKLELAYRRQHGEQPTPQEYVSRFPEDKAIVETLLRMQSGQGTRLPDSTDGPETNKEATIERSSSVKGSPRKARTDWPEINGYEILEKIGQGGMGVVYKARHLTLKRLVALKMILAGIHAGQEELRRFIGEAEAVAAFQHSNVVQVYEVGQQQNVPYIVLELVSGGSLADRLKDRPLTADESAHLIEQLAHGMNAAHQVGIVHRDLKPANILLADSAEKTIPKVTDFGLAKKVEGSGTITQTGAIVGTPSYMAPEQANGQSKRVGPAADVYALGAILYECLTGRPPFSTDNPMETLMQVIHEAPKPPSQVGARIPKDLQTICLKCLRKEPQKRYASAAELAEDLRRFQEGEPITARPIGWAQRAIKWVKRKPAAAALVAVSALALAAILIINVMYNATLQDLIGDAQQKQTDLTKKTRETTRLKSDLTKKAGETEKLKAAAAKANRLATERLGFVNLAAGSRHLEQGDVAEALLFFSEAAKIDRSDPERLKEHRARVQAFSRPLPRLTNVIEHDTGGILGGFYRFSPDFKFLATAGRKETRLWNLPRGTSFRFPDNDCRNFAFSSNGRYLCRWQSQHDDKQPAKSRLEIWDTKTTQKISPANGIWIPSRGFGITFAVGDRFVIAGWGRGRQLVFALPSGKPVPFPGPPLPPNGIEDLSPGGKYIVRVFDNTAAVWEIGSAQVTRMKLDSAEKIRRGYFDPTGRYLLLSTNHKKSKARSFQLWNPSDGRRLARITEPQPLKSFEFSSDGRYLYTASEKRVRIWHVSTGAPASLVMETTEGLRSAQFSQNGLFLLTQTNKQAKIWNTTTGTPIGNPISIDANSKPRYAHFGPGSRFVLNLDNRRIELWHVTGQLFWHYRVGGDASAKVNSAAFDPNGQFLVARVAIQSEWPNPQAQFHERGTIYVWRLSPTGEKPKLVLERPTIGSSAQWRFNPDGRLLQITDKRSMELWDLHSLRKIQLPPVDYSRIAVDRTFPNSRLLFLHNRDNDRIQLWNLFPSVPKEHFSFQGRVLQTVHTASKTLVAVSLGDDIHIWDMRAAKQLPHRFPKALSAQFSTNGRYVLLICKDGWVRVFDTDSGKQKTAVKSIEGPPVIFRFSDYGHFLLAFPQVVPRRLFTPPPAFPLSVWHLATGKLLVKRIVHSGEGAAYQIRASRDGSVFALLNSMFGTLSFTIHDGKTGQRLDQKLKKRPDIHSIYFSPKGDHAFLLGQQNQVYTWDPRNPDRLPPPIGGFDTSRGIVSADGKYLALQRLGKAQLTVWNLETGKPFPQDIPLSTSTGRKPSAFMDRFAIVRFCPSGKRVLIQEPVTERNESGMFSFPQSDWSQYAARMWDIETGKLLFPAVRCQNAAAQFSADGRYFYLLTQNGHGSIRNARTGFPLVIEPNITAPFSRIGKAKLVSPRPTFLSPNGKKIWRIQANTVQQFDYSARPTSLEASHRKAVWFAGKRIGHLGQLTFILEHDKEKLWADLKANYPEEFSIPDSKDMNNWRRYLLTDPPLKKSWFTQHWHLTRLIESEGGDPDLYRKCFLANLSLGRWRDALADGRRSKLTTPIELFALGVIQMEAGDIAGYRNTCQKALTWLEQDTVGSVVPLDVVVRLFLIGDHPKKSIQTLIQLVDKQKTLSLVHMRQWTPFPISNIFSRHFGLLGRLHYRAGQFGKAKKYFEAATCSPGGTANFLGLIAPPNSCPVSFAANLDQVHWKLWRLGRGKYPVHCLYIAMTMKKYGNADAAEAWLQEHFQKTTPSVNIFNYLDPATKHLQLPLHYLEERLLAREAGHVLSGNK